MTATKQNLPSKGKSFEVPLELIDILDRISDLNLLKVLLYIYSHMPLSNSGEYGLGWEEIVKDYSFSRHFTADELESALSTGANQGLLGITRRNGIDYYFPSADKKQEIRTTSETNSRAEIDTILGGLFSRYEDNIGPITPIISDAVIYAYEHYPAKWISEAIGIAVKMNKRNWKYIEAILKRWKEEGYGTLSDRRDTQKSDSSRQTNNDLEEFLKGD